MKMLIQWAQRNPNDWVEIDSSEWNTLAKKPIRPGGRPPDDTHLDNAPGWMFGVNIQGMDFGGGGHVYVRDLPGGVAEVASWRNDPDELSPDFFQARVATIRPLAPAARLGGAINTNQSFVLYAAPGRMAELHPPYQNTVLLPWNQFVVPPEAETRHTVWTSDQLADDHLAMASAHGWREWTEGLHRRELEPSGRLKVQRTQGRFAKAKGTITYFLHDDTLTSFHTADRERDMETNDLASVVARRCLTVADIDENCFVFTTLASNPNESDWGNGEYRCQIDVSSIKDELGYGFLTAGSAVGHMARVDSGLTQDEESWTQDESAFTGTGNQLATHTIDPASGAAGDRWECLLAFEADTMNGRIDIDLDQADSFSDGPFDGAAAPARRVMVVS